jgi:hypothetical protein
MRDHERKTLAKWPNEMPIPTEIGAHSYKHANGKPCCAVGHIMYALRSTCPPPAVVAQYPWRDAYLAAYRALYPHRPCLGTVEAANDRMAARDRKRLYLVSLALIGYTEGQPDSILEDTEAVKKVYPRYRNG